MKKYNITEKQPSKDGRYLVKFYNPDMPEYDCVETAWRDFRNGEWDNPIYSHRGDGYKIIAWYENVENFYFTFGSNKDFPYQNTYLVVIARNIEEAIKKFKNKYPHREGSNCINCAFYYNEKEWNEGTKKYYSEEPAEIIE